LNIVSVPAENRLVAMDDDFVREKVWNAARVLVSAGMVV